MENAFRILRLHPTDSVGVALADLAAGVTLGEALRTRTDIPRGHKVALKAIGAGEAVSKLGTVIGVATRAIDAGEHVHTHNLRFQAIHGTRTVRPRNESPIELVTEPRNFDGYLRSDGRVGTRNYLAVMATVNCSATVVRAIADRFSRRVGTSTDYDGVIALTHDHGCSVRADGRGLQTLRRTLGGYADHPNVAGALVIGLGCEDNQIEDFLDSCNIKRSEQLRTLAIQEIGGTSAAIDAGVQALEAMMPLATSAHRTSVDARHLTVGLQCGGSDGFSTLTANPALGRAVDRLVAIGGTAILSETPEIYGAESLLLDRVAHPEVGEKLIALLEWWEEQSRRDGGSLDNNPSPGNKEGGITTIVEKSLGAVAKAGSSTLNGVYAYAERIDKQGLVFMDSPGYDPVSATGQVASGANLLCFTTGRGSCFGAKPAPSLKLATNTEVFRRMEGDMDLNCGGIADGTADIDSIGERIFERMLETASGKRTKSEELGYGDAEFIPWVPGLTY